MIDTHSHLNTKPLFKDWHSHVNDAVAAGVTQIIVLGTDHPTNQQAIDIASQSNHCFAAVGLHPELATQIIEQRLDLDQLLYQLESLLPNQNIVAIGEVGIDYHWIANHPQLDQIKQVQHHLLKAQIQLAHKHNLPLSIHVRDAQPDILSFLQNPSTKAVLHCFDGNQDYLHQAIAQNLYISFAGNLTFKNATHLQSLIKQVPQNLLLLETDSPYLNPHRGQFPNTPANIVKTYQFAADLLGQEPQQLQQQIHQNATRLFGI